MPHTNNHANTIAQKADRLFDAERYEEALTLYSEAIQLNPNEADFYLNRGLVYDYLERYQEAITDYTHAIHLDPQLSDSYNNRGRVYSFFGRISKSLDGSQSSDRIRH